MEIPISLIHNLQLKLRNQAGVPSFDLSDESITPLPPFQDALSKIDADPDVPPYLRCDRCNKQLLRGIRSTICVFCGHEQRREGFSHSLTFTSTAAYRNLLRSLDLDGSEVVNLDTELNDSNKSRDMPNSGLVLSSLLDLELQWPSEDETFSSSLKKNPINAPAVNLSGVDLDTFFSDSKNDTASSAPSVSGEHLMPKEQIVNTEITVPSGSQNFNLFENHQSSNMEVSSNAEGVDAADSFADWDAEFQSAGSETFPAESKAIDNIQDSSIAESDSQVITAVTFATDSKSFDLFHGSSGTEFANHATLAPTHDLHTDVEHERSNRMNSGEPLDNWGQISTTGNSVENDLWSHSAHEFKSTSEIHNNETPINDWGQEDMFPMGSINKSNDAIKRSDDDHDDLFGSSKYWPEFTNANKVSEVSSHSKLPTGTEATSNEHASKGKSGVMEDMDFGSFIHSDIASEALFGQKGSYEVIDQEQNASASTSHIEEVKDTKNLNDRDYTADIWQDFTRPSVAPINMSSLWNQTSTEAMSSEHALGKKLEDPQDMDFGSFVQSDSFSGALGLQKDSSEANDVLTSTSSTIEVPSMKRIEENNNSLEAWQDFTGSKEALGGLSISWTTSNEAIPSQPPSGVMSVPQDVKFGSFFQSYSSAEVGGHQDSNKENTISIDALLSTSGKKELNSSEIVKDSDDPFDAWQFLTTSNDAPSGLSKLSTQTDTDATSYEPPSDQGVSNKENNTHLNALVSVSSAKKLNDAENMNEYDDPFGAWQDFTSSHNTARVLSNMLTQTSSNAALCEHASSTKSVNLQEMESGSALHSGYSGALGGKKGSIELNGVQFGSSIPPNRTNEADAETAADSRIQGAANSDECDNASSLEASNSKIEMLLSEMPDLSFMLDSNLSIPKKVDTS